MTWASMYMVGDPDWEQCKRLAMAAAVNYTGRDWLQLKIDTNCKENVSLLGGSSTFDATAVANHTKQFHALSGFSVIKNTLNLSSKPSLAEIWEQGEKLCSSSQKQTDAGLLCFWGPYIASLIEHTLCLSNADIVFGPGDLSWTLGAALIEGEHLWSDSPKTDGSHTTTLKSLGLMSSPVLLFLLLVSLLMSSAVYCSQLRMPMQSRKTLATHTSLPSFINPKYRPN